MKQKIDFDKIEEHTGSDKEIDVAGALKSDPGFLKRHLGSVKNPNKKALAALLRFSFITTNHKKG